MEKLLFTGASGFLGRNVLPLLEESYEVTTLGRSDQNHIKVNIAEEIPQLRERYDIILHAAGKAHVVPRNREEEQAFFAVNCQGTIQVCKALERVGLPRAFLFISSVAVYGVERGENISEAHPLNGTTPYAQSKIRTEKYLRAWAKRQGVMLGILRLPLVMGTHPPGNLGAMIKGIATGRYLSISHGRVRKSMLMAEDIVRILPRLTQVGGIYNICDDYHPSVGELENSIAAQLGKKPPVSLPYFLAKGLAVCGDVLGDSFPIHSTQLKKITQTLTFSNGAAKKALEWTPIPVLENFKIT